MQIEEAFKLVVTPGSCVFDVGSFTGEIAGQLAMLTGESGTICAFEPHPLLYFELAALAGHVGTHNHLNILPYCKAMSDSVGHTTFYLSQFVSSPDFNQASSIVPELANKERLGDGLIGIKVETTTLDEFCQNQFSIPSFIKIDTEGADAKVIAGGARIIERSRPAIITEFGYDPHRDLPTNNLSHLKMLEGMGYDIFLVDILSLKNEWVQPDSKYLSDAIYPLRSDDVPQLPGVILGNLLCLPRSAPAFDGSPIRKRIAPISALQFLSS